MVTYILLTGGAATLCYLAYTDYRSHLIDHIPIILLFLLGWIFRIVSTAPIKDGLLGMFLGFGIGIVWFLVGMGGGDAKLMAVLGIWVGWHNLLVIFFMASVAGALWGVYRLHKAGELKDRAVKFYNSIVLQVFYHAKGALQFEKVDPGEPIPKTAVPFGTCLALATFACIVFKGVNVIGIS